MYEYRYMDTNTVDGAPCILTCLINPDPGTNEWNSGLIDIIQM